MRGYLAAAELVYVHTPAGPVQLADGDPLPGDALEEDVTRLLEAGAIVEGEVPDLPVDPPTEGPAGGRDADGDGVPDSRDLDKGAGTLDGTPAEAIEVVEDDLETPAAGQPVEEPVEPVAETGDRSARRRKGGPTG